jgi:hypothetical protein
MTRQSQDHSLTLKLVRTVTPALKLKARVGYKWEFIQETKDEQWGNGLFDYTRLGCGFDAEKTAGTTILRAGFDYYTFHYPHYRSLAKGLDDRNDDYTTSLDSTTMKEISSQAGENVLDFSTVALSFEAVHAFSRNTAGTLNYSGVLKNFSDQKVIEHSGTFGGTSRADTSHCLSGGIETKTARMTLGVSDEVQYYVSNQNSYDAANSVFTEGYYSYIQQGIIPRLTVALCSGEQPVKLSLSWELSWRWYTERPALNSGGAPIGEKVFQSMSTSALTVMYPMPHSLALNFSTSYRAVSSNMKFEKNYKYNYYTLNYFCGMAWHY